MQASSLEPPAENDALPAELDVLIVGAGLSGIGAAWHFQRDLSGMSWLIVEARAAIGGTWDLFRYPGIRSDSDMHTLGYPFRPWESPKALADGPSILAYIRETAAENGIDRHIRFRHKVVAASWDSTTARWTVTLDHDGAARTLRCRFLYMCAGYYDYEAGYQPHWPEMERFRGTFIHPQGWPEGLDHAGKRVVVIGSGATAVTIVPAMTDKAAHVTMLQRSPTWIVPRPGIDPWVEWLKRRLPYRMALRTARWKNILQSIYFFQMARRRPEWVKGAILKALRMILGPEADLKPFTPSYNPWDQRICLVPDADLFMAVKAGKAEVVTDTIARFTETGIELASGRVLPADIVVSATGLNLKMLGGVAITVDGQPVDPARCLTYKGMMFSDVPNLAAAIGYINASWTLKSELTAEYVGRLLKHLRQKGQDFAVARRGDVAVEDTPILALMSGYVKRAAHVLPRQGSARPWRNHHNYLLDMASLRFGAIEDGVMAFGRASRAGAEPAAANAARPGEREAA